MPRLGRRRPCSTCSTSLGATITVCPRRADDPPGDPAVLRFREAVAAGAVPFSVQGPENALCLDGGRTIGWELADAGRRRSTGSSSRSAAARSPRAPAGASAPGVRLDAVQTEGVRAAGPGVAASASRLGARRRPGRLGRADDAVGRPALGGRRDPRRRDLRLARRRRRDAASGGQPVVVPEAAVARAHELAAATGIPVSATGSAGAGRAPRPRRARRPPTASGSP